MRTARTSQKTRLVAVSALALATLAPMGAPASAQGLFEALFGRRDQYYRPAPPVFHPPGYDPGYQPRYAARPPASRRAEPRHRKSTKSVADADDDAQKRDTRSLRYAEPSKPEPYVAPKVLPGPVGRFLLDPTLRRGDVVATAKGLMVYRGSGGERHKEKDFVALDDGGKKFVQGNKKTLLALDNVMKRSSPLIVHRTRVAANEDRIVAQDDPDLEKAVVASVKNKKKRTR